MIQITDEILNKYLDGELSRDEAEQVKSELRASEELQRKFNALKLVHEKLFDLKEDEVKNLILRMQEKFPGCELSCEVANTYIVNLLKRKIWRRKFQRDFHLGKDASFFFGIHDSNELETWNKGITFLDDWTYFDDKEKKLGWMNIFAKSKKLAKSQWIVHYLLK